MRRGPLRAPPQDSYGFIKCCERAADLFFHYSALQCALEELSIGATPPAPATRLLPPPPPPSSQRFLCRLSPWLLCTLASPESAPLLNLTAQGASKSHNRVHSQRCLEPCGTHPALPPPTHAPTALRRRRRRRRRRDGRELRPAARRGPRQRDRGERGAGAQGLRSVRSAGGHAADGRVQGAQAPRKAAARLLRSAGRPPLRVALLRVGCGFRDRHHVGSVFHCCRRRYV